MAALSRPRKIRTQKPVARRNQWFERLMASLALLNLVLVAFDLSYIRFRDFYLREFPALTQWYGAAFKGIEPERTTTAYLEIVDQLEEQVSQTGLQSAEARTLLQELRDRSSEIIDENPFQIADKTGTLERIKNLVREQVGTDSAKDAFNTFWSQSYLESANWGNSIGFFNSEVRPLIETNYYRPVWEDGEPLDQFWLLDQWFIYLFAIELALRTLLISRRYQGTSWLDAILLRWYDLFLLLPFWRWLRIIPVIVRINQSNLIDLDPLRSRINRLVISNIAVELTEIIVLRIISQAQNLIREGEVAKWLVKPDSGQKYIDLNDVDEVQAISSRLTSLLVYRVLPQIKPEIDNLIQHSITNAVDQTPVYQGLQAIPGMSQLPSQLTRQIAAEISKNAYGALTGALEDEAGAALTQKLITHLVATAQEELQKDSTLADIEALTIALLDEVKVNYVQRIAAEDVEAMQQRNYELYETTRRLGQK
ncbi:hypothetical protein [Almyronema epifaneia]|uniref:Uncharacterized protein n=1 Tax=Almyronema epifaneia S1 TaxID=2991925 RepID=A0ABW6IF31_9CYAN